MLLTQAATLVTVTYFRHKFMEDVAIGYIVTTIRTLRAAVSQVPAEERAEFVRAASQNQWRLWSRVLPVEARLQRFGGRHPPPPGRAEAAAGQRHARAARAGDMTREEDEERSAARAAERMLDRREGGSPYRSEVDDVRRDLRGLQQLNERLNDGTRVALSRGPTPEIFISLAPNSDSEDVPRLREWLVIPLERLDPPVSTPLAAAWLGGLGLLLLLAVGFSWHITRPLTRLADAADRLAAGQPQRVDPAGPTETRALGERFNAMLDALAESDSVRRTLLAGLPHDLKGPLSRMWLRIELADDSKLGRPARGSPGHAAHGRPVHRLRARHRSGGYRYASMALQDWLVSACAPGRARAPTSGCTAPRIRPWWCRRTPRWAACWTT